MENSAKLNQVDLNKLHAFLAVAEAGGVTAAARRLALTPSAVSQALSGLEASLGVSLFLRTGRRLVPTAEGRLLQERLREYHAQLGWVLDEIANEEREVRGLVRIGLFPGFSRLRLARLLADFTGRYPSARVRVFYGAQQELDERLRDGRLDLTVSFHPRSRSARRVRSTRLVSQELLLVASRRWTRRRLIWEDLAALPVVDYYQSDPLIHRWIRHHFRRRPPPLDVRVWAATTDLVLELVLARAGVGVLPRDLVEPPLRRGRLHALRGSDRELTDVLWLNELETLRRGAAMDTFRSALLETFERP